MSPCAGTPTGEGGVEPCREELLPGSEYAHLYLIDESTGIKRNIPDHMSYQSNHKIGGAGDPGGASGSCPLGAKPKVVRGHPCTPGFRQTAGIHNAV